MEVSVEMTIPARGWHAYGKIVWQSPRKGEKLTTEKEKNKEALDIDLYAVAWMLKRKNKLIRLIVCHVPREISPIHLLFLYAWWNNGSKCIIYSTITIPDPKWRIKNHA